MNINVSIRAKILLASSVTLILLIILGIVSYSSIQNLLSTNGMVVHTYKVLQKASNLVAAGVDMETGQRGFMLAGKEGFLDPIKAECNVLKKEL